eukprot:gene23914-28957_t
METSTVVRSFEQRDQTAVEALYRKGFDIYKDFCVEIHILTQWFKDDKLAKGNDMSSIQSHYMSNPQKHFWVAENNGEVVGCVGGMLGGDFSLSEASTSTLLPDLQPHIELVRMCVSDTVRGEGVAAMLLDTLGAYGKQRGCRYIVLSTLDGMTPACKFYTKQGFYLYNQRIIDMDQHVAEHPPPAHLQASSYTNEVNVVFYAKEL